MRQMVALWTYGNHVRGAKSSLCKAVSEPFGRFSKINKNMPNGIADCS